MARLFAALAVLLLLLTAVLGVASPALRDLTVDASTDSLVLEDDAAGTFYDRTSILFTSDEFVLVGVTRDDLFQPGGVAAIESLVGRLGAIEGVQDVLAITNRPLFRSHKGDVPLFTAISNPVYLNSADLAAGKVDPQKAREELTHHELYAGNLISRDGGTAGVVVNLVVRPDNVEAVRTWLGHLDERAQARDALAAAGDDAAAAGAARERLERAEASLAAYRPTYEASEAARKAERIRVVRKVRAIVEELRAEGVDARASGVPAIVVEMVEAIQKDLYTFFALSALFVLLFLAVVFRRPRWMLIPLLITLSTVVWTLLLLHWLDKRITVITANIPALLLVIGLAHSIHLIVRYRELLVLQPEASRAARAWELVRSLFWPCLFTMTTTAVGFLSLYFAGSRPIIDFGLLMSVGVALAFALSFIVLPGLLTMLPDVDSGRLERSARFLEDLGAFSLRRRGLVTLVALGLLALGVGGILRLKVEARFIDYFDPSTSLYKGLRFVDQRLGGTSGLEVVIMGDQGAFGPTQPENLEKARELAKWLEDRPEIGTVMAYTGFLDELAKLNFPQKNPAALTMALNMAVDQRTLEPYIVLQEKSVGGRVIKPYGAVRIVARAYETRKGLQRNELLRQVKEHLAQEFPPPVKGQPGLVARPTGMFVLYANMLASLVRSQVITSVVALSAIFLMLTALFRSASAALLALPPNMLPIVLVVGAMGWAGVQLDMATVMIASVSLGIGIDAAIHYLFRFRDEFRRDGDLEQAIRRSHGSIGTSILYTSLTTVVGFAVLYFSEFRPNAYFGMLTGLAMVTALFGMLTLLPVLLSVVNPFRREAPPAPSGSA